MKHPKYEFPPGAEVFLPKEKSAAEYCFICIVFAVILGTYSLVFADRFGGWIVAAVMAVVTILLYLLQRVEQSQYLFLLNDQVTFRDGFGKLMTFRWAEITSYRVAWNRWGWELKLYQGENRITVSGRLPGSNRIYEIIRQRNIPPHFSGRERPDHFRVTLLLRVEGDELVRRSPFGKKTCPMSDVRFRQPLFRKKIYDSEGNHFASLPLDLSGARGMQLVRLQWVLEQHGVLCGDLLPKL